MTSNQAQILSIKMNPEGIGTILKNHRLIVPPNQREYSWEEKHVQELFQDLQKAIDQPGGNFYFLGTIALTGKNANSPEVTDGQQRLATTTILIATIRDYF